MLTIALALAFTGCAQVNPSPTSSAAGQSGGGSATLSWSPVTQNTDGTVLTNLAGYTVHYGASPAELSTTVVLADPTQTSYVVSPLTVGTWYFAVSAYTTNGVQGELSNVASKTIATTAAE